MNLKVSTEGGNTLVSLEGMLDTSSAPEFQELVNKLIANKELNLTVDLNELSYISSQGIRSVLTLIKSVSAGNGKLVFRNIRPAVREIFDMCGLSQAMTIE